MVRLRCPEVSQNPELTPERFQGSNLQGDIFVIPSSVISKVKVRFRGSP